MSEPLPIDIEDVYYLVGEKEVMLRALAKQLKAAKALIETLERENGKLDRPATGK